MGDATSPYSISEGGHVVIDKDISVISTDSTAITSAHQNVSVSVFGTVASLGSAIDLDATNAGHAYRVDIGKTGTVTSDDYTLYIGSTSDPDPTGDFIEVHNDGTISSALAIAVCLFYSQTVNVVNHGDIFSNGDDGFSNAVLFIADVDISLVNTGTISSVSNFGINGAIYAAAVSTSGVSGVSYVMNSGTITGLTYSYFNDTTGSETLINTGLMNGSVEMSAAVGGELLNSGQIIGDVNMYGGDDIYSASLSGSVTGAVYGGDGYDSLTGADQNDRLNGGNDNDTLSGAAGDDGLFGGEGSDTLFGGRGADLMIGDNGGDVMYGGADEDVMYGGNGADTMRGKADDDVIYGGKGGDDLYGGAGDDLIHGDKNGDVIHGNAGDDVIYGDEGTDTLYGGSGADTFVFASLGDSGTGSSKDVIGDFSRGEDLVDLTGIANDISFVASGGFDGTAHQLTFSVVGAGVLLKYDSDGDTTVDMQVLLTGLTDFSASDLLL